MRTVVLAMLLVLPLAAIVPTASAQYSIHFALGGDDCSVQGLVHVDTAIGICPYASLFGFLDDEGCDADECRFELVTWVGTTDHGAQTLSVEAHWGTSGPLLDRRLLCADEGPAPRVDCEAHLMPTIALARGECRDLHFSVGGNAGTPLSSRTDRAIPICRVGDGVEFYVPGPGVSFGASSSESCAPGVVPLAYGCPANVWGYAHVGACEGGACTLDILANGHGRGFGVAPRMLILETGPEAAPTPACVAVTFGEVAACRAFQTLAVSVADGACETILVRATLLHAGGADARVAESRFDICRAGDSAWIVGAGGETA
jgi:hypothetical protein